MWNQLHTTLYKTYSIALLAEMIGWSGSYSVNRVAAVQHVFLSGTVSRCRGEQTEKPDFYAI